MLSPFTKTNTRLLFAGLVTSLLLCSAAMAQNAAPSASSSPGQKIAVIDMEKVFKDYYKTKIADANLKKQGDLFKAYAEKLSDSLLKLKEEFKDLRDASQNIALSETERENKRLSAQDKYRHVTAKESELNDYTREKQAQLRSDYDKMRSGILAEIKDVVRSRCALEGYSLVLDISGNTLNNIPAVIYHNSSLELTSAVLSELNRGHSGKDAPKEGSDDTEKLPAKEKNKDKK